MTVVYTFALGTAISFVLALAVALVLRPHLARMLSELCGSEVRAGFWTVASVLAIFLIGLLSGTVSYGYEGMKPTTEMLFFGLVTQVRACLIGLLVSVLGVAWFLVGQIRRFEQGLSPAPVDGKYRSAPQVSAPSAVSLEPK